jgi:hypothetical protein
MDKVVARKLRPWEGRTLHIVMDNVAYHLTSEVMTYGKANRIKLYLTPWHGSRLNRIESHFTSLREFCLDNTDHRSHEEQQATIDRYLAWRDRRRSISVKDWRRYRRAA